MTWSPYLPKPQPVPLNTDPKPYPHTNRDGTQTWREGGEESVRDIEPPGTNESPHAGEFVDELTAIQLGMWMVLDSLTFTTADRAALVEGRLETNTLRFERVFLDWPDTEDDQVPVPSAAIMATGPQEIQYSTPLHGQQLIEDTVDVYRPGTVLRHLGELSATLEVVVWLMHKDERAAVRRGLVEAFAAEPDDERSGRRVNVPWYFDRPARLFLQSIEYQDNADQARSKIWPLVARFAADIQVVRLVAAPATLRPLTQVDPTAIGGPVCT